MLGVFADDPDTLLWGCSTRFGDKGEATAAKTFDLKTRAPIEFYALPGDDALCNDFAIAHDRTADIGDTNQAIIFMLKPSAKFLELAAKDPLLAGADGLASGDDVRLCVNSVTKNRLLRLDLGKDGKSRTVVDPKVPRAVHRPDGMRAIGKQRLLLAENGGTMSAASFSGPGMRTVALQNLKKGLEPTRGVTATNGMAWIVECKLNYISYPEFKDKDPGPFKLSAAPLPKP